MKNSKPLLIVESPSKARTIAKYLGNQYEVLACLGHIKDLPRGELGVNVEKGFEARLQTIPARKTFIKELKAKAKEAPEVIIATDPDREGEAIAAHIASEIPKTKISRVQFTEITKQGILEGMAQRGEINQHLVQAQWARRILDRLVGYKLSPVLWNTLQKNMKFVKESLSAGRVQSAAVKIIVDRERERARFRQATYYDLKAWLLNENMEVFNATLTKLNNKRLATGKDFNPHTGELTNPEVVLLSSSQAEALVDELKPGPWVVASIEEKPQTTRPRPPFTTSTLQQEAAYRLRFAPRKTMRIAQGLYEAGFITYMRTDSTHLSSEALSAARQEIVQRFGDEYLPARPIQYKSKVKNIQEAHEAIRPAGSHFTNPETLPRTLGPDAQRLYTLIWKRTLACQMNPARWKQTIVTITNQKAEFNAAGKVILFPGFMRVYEDKTTSNGRPGKDQERLLPPLRPKEHLSCEKLQAEEHTTKPPARFTEATLVKELEAQGIGRPSTYASIINKIVQRDYVEIKKGTLVPTFLAVAVTQLLENHFEPLVDTQFTAQMEDNLDAISRGELKPKPFMKQFYFGDDQIRGLADMLQEKIDIAAACTINVAADDKEAIVARVGNYGPYLQQGSLRKKIPSYVAPGDLTPEKAEEIIKGNEEQHLVVGIDPETGSTIYLREGPYGPYLQLGETKTRRSLPKGLQREEVDLETALKLLSLPRTVGVHPETKEEIKADYGRYGPYLKMGNQNAKLRPPLTPLNITLEQAVAVLNQRKHPGPGKLLGQHSRTGETLFLKEGRYGPYVTDGSVNASLPKDLDPATLTLEMAEELINQKRAAGPTKRKRKKR